MHSASDIVTLLSGFVELYQIGYKPSSKLGVLFSRITLGSWMILVLTVEEKSTLNLQAGCSLLKLFRLKKKLVAGS